MLTLSSDGAAPHNQHTCRSKKTVLMRVALTAASAPVHARRSRATQSEVLVGSYKLEDSAGCLRCSWECWHGLAVNNNKIIIIRTVSVAVLLVWQRGFDITHAPGTRPVELTQRTTVVSCYGGQENDQNPVRHAELKVVSFPGKTNALHHVPQRTSPTYILCMPEKLTCSVGHHTAG